VRPWLPAGPEGAAHGSGLVLVFGYLPSMAPRRYFLNAALAKGNICRRIVQHPPPLPGPGQNRLPLAITVV